MDKVEKIGILGGTFNPVHTGHLELGRQFAALLGLDKILLIPTCVPPHKSNEGVASFAHRFAMCKLACGDDPLFSVSDIENKRQGVSYTVDTLDTAAREHPGAKLYLLVGSDMLLIFKQWRRYEDILRKAAICTVRRIGEDNTDFEAYAASLRELGGEIVLADFSVSEMSSTQIREMVKNGENTSGYLADSVASYIKEHNLYKD